MFIKCVNFQAFHNYTWLDITVHEWRRLFSPVIVAVSRHSSYRTHAHKHVSVQNTPFSIK